MAGHSHWAKIKRAKGANDAKRGKVWSKIARKIIIAARGGGDPNRARFAKYFREIRWEPGQQRSGGFSVYSAGHHYD
jgi:hypothetical protein